MARGLERLLSKFKKTESGCWEWTAFRDSAGYGRYTPSYKSPLPAHRVIYELLMGSIPDGLTLDHLCRNRACVNPAHLEPVTMRENILRGTGPTALNAKKTSCLRGHPFDSRNTAKATRSGGRRCRACHREDMRSRRQEAVA